MKELINFILDNSNNRKEQRFKKFFPKEYEEILSWDFPDNFRFSQKLYHYINNDRNLSLGICPVCGNRCEWRGFGVEYLTYCSKKCMGESEEHRKNIKNAMNNRSDDKKEKTRKLQSEIQKRKSIEERQEIINKRLKTINDKGQDFINEFRQRQRQSLIIKLRSKTEEEKRNESIRKSNIWKNKSDDEKKAQINKMHNGLENMHKDKNRHILWKNNVANANKSKSLLKIQNAKNKEWETKINNGTINTSSCENDIENWLISNNIKYFRNYNKDKRYPYHVDFYLPDYDLFIEIQGHWSHGKHPFNKFNKDDIQTLQKWENKAQNSNFYKSAINVWTNTDVSKRNTAKNNELNYIEIFSINIDYIINEIEKRISV